MRYCEHCGKKVDPQAKFCPHCGKKLAPTEAPQSKKPVTDDGVSAPQPEGAADDADRQKESDKLRTLAQTSAEKAKEADTPPTEQAPTEEMAEETEAGADEDSSATDTPADDQEMTPPTQASRSQKKDAAPKKKKASKPKKKGAADTKEKPSLMNRLLRGTVIVALLIFGGFYWWGSQKFTEERAIERFEEAFKENDAKALAQAVSGEKGDDFKSTAHSVQPLLDYYEQYPELLEETLAQIKGGGENYGEASSLARNGEVRVEAVGRKFLFFKDYRVVFPTFSVKLRSSPGVTVAWGDDELFSYGDAAQEPYTFGPILPGIYTFDLSVEMDGETHEAQEQAQFGYASRDNIYLIDVERASVRVTSNLKEGTVYLDDRKLGELEDGAFESDEFLFGQGQEVYVKSGEGEDEIKTESRTISPGNNALYLQADTLTRNDAQHLLATSLYSDLATDFPLSKEAETKIADAYFIDGTANDFWKELSEQLRKLAGEDDRARGSFKDFTLESFEPLGKDRAEVTYQVTWHVTPSADGTEPRKETFRYTGVTIEEDEDGKVRFSGDFTREEVTTE